MLVVVMCENANGLVVSEGSQQASCGWTGRDGGIGMRNPD